MRTSVNLLLGEGYAFRDGRLTTDRMGAHIRTVSWKGRSLGAMSVAGSEHLTLPRLEPRLRDIGTYFAWPGAQAWQLQGLSVTLGFFQRVAPARRAMEAAWSTMSRLSTGGPSEEQRRRNRSAAFAAVRDERGQVLAESEFEGPDPYDVTAAFCAWGAMRYAEGALRGSGALGPVEAFGLEELEQVASSLGAP